MLLLSANIMPRPDLTPEQFRQLGTVLEVWIEYEKQNGLVLDAEQHGIDSLLAGEPPMPAALRFLAAVDDWRVKQGLAPFTGEEREERIREFGGSYVPSVMVEGFKNQAASRCVVVCLTPGRGREVLASLLEEVPAELVEEVRLTDGSSWKPASA